MRNHLRALVAICCFACVLSSLSHAQYSDDATLTPQANGSLVLKANNPRPVYQAREAFARTYKTLIDYEDPLYNQKQMYSGTQQLKGGKFTALLLPIKDRQSELSAIRSLLRQFHSSYGITFKLKTYSSNERDDIVGQSPSMMPPLLDTPVLLPQKPRTVDETIHKILSLVEEQRGIKISRGGLASNLNMQVVVGGNKEKPAREWLAQTLDAWPQPLVWNLGYEPTNGDFALGLETIWAPSYRNLPPLPQGHPKSKPR